MKTHREKYDELERKRRLAEAPAGAEAVEKQHARGKRTAAERIDALVDPGSFGEFDRFAVHRTNAFGLDEKEFLGDGVVTGRATIDGRQVFLFSQDFTVLGGSLGEAFAEKICKVMDLAVRTGSPMIGINDSGGARIQEGVVIAWRLRRNLLAQRASQRRHPADQLDRRAVRGRRRLLAGHHRLHHHDREASRRCSSPARKSSKPSPAKTSRSRSWAAR